ncbi:MAG: hypothetical protein LH660_06745 [Phormidesmis sp. CAN_BIN36]|nr:hypothetical protein [Phormidesmis sp. CAN_BIN36]
MSQSFRKYWRDPVQGRTWFNYNLPGIVVKRPSSSVSSVIVTVCEYKLAGGIFGGAGSLVRGDANIWVSNVHPYIRVNSQDLIEQNGGIEFVVNVDWGSPLLVATTITVFDEDVQVEPGEEV